MKKTISIMLCAASLLCLLSGCQNADSYTPTGNALSGEDEVVATKPQTQTKPQNVSLIYYAEKTMNPYLCTDFTKAHRTCCGKVKHIISNGHSGIICHLCAFFTFQIFIYSATNDTGTV